MDSVEELLDEVRLLWHAMTRTGERLHEAEPVTLGMRAILEFLTLHGAGTVPHIARSRHVTRQHVQGLVNALLDLDLVALETNPAHKRSVLVRLTPEGQRTIERMRRRERRFFERVPIGGKPDDLRRAAETLRTVRKSLGGRA